MSDRAAEIRARLETATPGYVTWELRWQCPIDPDTDQPIEHHHDWDEGWIAGAEHGDTIAMLNERYTSAPQHGEFIAHAPEDIAWLLAERDRLLAGEHQ